MDSSQVLGFHHLSIIIGFSRATSKGLFSKIRVDGAWIREGDGYRAVKVKSWLADGVWVGAGGGFGAAKVKYWRINYVYSTSMVFSSKIDYNGKVAKLADEPIFIVTIDFGGFHSIALVGSIMRANIGSTPSSKVHSTGFCDVERVDFDDIDTSSSTDDYRDSHSYHI
ncbi:hypothetical protein V6N13_020348 [Hibiscus sabdariffa]